MADDRLVPLSRPGEIVNIAVTPHDFFNARVVRKDGAPIEAQAGGEHFMTYAEANYRLTDYFESKEPYDGPKTLRQYQNQQKAEENERAAPRAEVEKSSSAKDEKAK